MGNWIGKSSAKVTHELILTTGDKKGAGLHHVNVYMTFTGGRKGESHEVKITDRCKNGFHRGRTDEFHLDLPTLDKITEISIRRDGTGEDEKWYVETIEVNKVTKTRKRRDKELVVAHSIFPVNRWINANSKFTLVEYDSILPQHDLNRDQREKELRGKREAYTLSGKILGAPPEVEILPDDEKFSKDYQWDIVGTLLKMKAKTVLVSHTTAEFTSLADIESVYKGILTVPKGIEQWRSDEEFGNQKLNGCNPGLLELCQNIPEHLEVTAEMIQKHLEGKSLDEAFSAKNIYIIDLRYLAEIECSDDRKLPGPTCLLYVRDSGDLVPIAIQLMPQPGVDNPVFTPSDPEYTWLAAKMWFNLADCSHHQSATHLGLTHLLMESVTVCTNRRLSPSHPIYRLLAPHFIYLLAINSLAISSLVSPGGWVDNAMHIGRTGMFNIIKKKWAEWSLKEDGNLLTNLKKRGVDDVKVLPKYHYRDDSILLWNAIHRYVSAVVDQVYDTREKLEGDGEIQGWCKELVEDADFNGLPGRFTNNEELTEVLTVFIFTSSVAHAAANFGQYDEYAFPPNYPSVLHVDRPTTKEPLTEDYIVQALPPKSQALDIMLITKVLSEKGTNELGNFEMQYAHDPISLDALARFKADLKEISVTIDERNEKRERKYPYLNPRDVPNAISI